MFLKNKYLITHQKIMNTNCLYLKMKHDFTTKKNIKYIDKGNGTTIILLHGLMGSLSNFKSCIEELQKGFRIIMPILPI